MLAIYERDGSPVAKIVAVPSQHDPAFTYSVGAVVKPRLAYDGSPWVECTSGIHFYLTREEAEAN